MTMLEPGDRVTMGTGIGRVVRVMEVPYGTPVAYVVPETETADTGLAWAYVPASTPTVAAEERALGLEAQRVRSQQARQRAFMRKRRLYRQGYGS